MANDKSMNPMSGEEVETDGIYTNEWGREEKLKRGDEFPADPVLGNTEWELTSLPLESQEEEFYKDTTANTKKRSHYDHDFGADPLGKAGKS
ncbi:hypothetical protein [Paenibacillus mucilaginosus]|uniref:Uncharacterized protein n=1 Tax=Paenibacillus mucilaginosus (strain KNP414) TaxID=1036673 RepID=F8FPF0_PAEMK|nr:hypothetical protein [Paenibacillus mucilaginosus]AEI39100.1 hypothetical protein KNP414_00475 [Paenibacillus mucilaginosus KNP414]MCG7216225.1 hypothetical protein [Paenibacillus mucilaginosus]WDM28124.1 hypothetical protein KCX80_02250 [Paenibacillus mucilaginosus]